MICDHLDGDPDVVSDFSSWTQIWSSALGFSGYPHDGEGMIAVLDTTSVEEHVWHTVALVDPGELSSSSPTMGADKSR
jgi:hypothetical protein